ncbi:rho gtpase-activating protein [Lynx pardinus]|uniref:Rho GTPase-activating protein 36 n=1 Tax=Lynx pardinus TaxID=191816 RepID=A0A485NPU8_LYNPA|nr:rho gtpase-activating protein [Lynx pardinus]
MSGSVLTAQSLEPASDSVSPSLCPFPPTSNINKCTSPGRILDLPPWGSVFTGKMSCTAPLFTTHTADLRVCLLSLSPSYLFRTTLPRSPFLKRPFPRVPPLPQIVKCVFLLVHGTTLPRSSKMPASLPLNTVPPLIPGGDGLITFLFCFLLLPWPLFAHISVPLSIRALGTGSIRDSLRKSFDSFRSMASSNFPATQYLALALMGDFTWNSMSGRSVRLRSVPIQSLSELERARLQEVAFYQLQQDCDLSCPITIPKDGQKRKKSLRKKLDSLGKEKNKDREFIPQAFGMPLSQVIANDRAYKLKQDSQRDEQKDASDFVASLLPFGNKRQNKELSSSNSSLSSTSETPNESTSPNTPEPAPRARRRGAMSVDSITDLDDSQSRLLEALQLSLPAEAHSKKEKARDKKLSLNPIYRQVPRLVDSCCQHLEKHGLQTVGIFRVGSSKKRVRQLREEFDRGVDVSLEEEHSVHDVAALLKEFLRDMPDPLLTRELYTAFINTLLLEPEEQLGTLQLLIYLLPPCNCDTLHRLLQFLSMVARHANDNVSKDGQEVTGNKMTSLNLATIFGPNLLHKQKSSDKEFSVQSSARAEESTAIIAVVQKMIENYEALFMVPPDLQNEVLISLLETDPDVVDYLLRRKASQSSSPDMLRSEVSFSVGGRHSSTDSNKASSGDLSPYDNNSPVLSERSLLAMQDDAAPGGSEKLYKGPEQYVLVSHLPSSKSRESSPGPRLGKDMAEEPFNIWGTWHSTLKSGSKDPGMTVTVFSFPAYFLVNERTGQWRSGDIGAKNPFVREMQSFALPSVSSSLNLSQVDLSLTSRHSVDRAGRGGAGSSGPHSHSGARGEKRDKRPPPPYPGPGKQALASARQPAESLLWRPQKPEEGSRTASEEPRATEQNPSTAYSGPAGDQNSKTLGDPDWLDWQRERWQIWELLSTDNPDALPETLV